MQNAQGVTIRRKRRRFKMNDTILPKLVLPNPCPISIEITADEVSLCIGPRDWQWSRVDGALLGCGTMLG